MIGLQDILRSADLAPETVNVMLHSPRDREGDLLQLMPGLLSTRRAVFGAYQAMHSINAERALPPSWAARLRGWRDGALYVGSAYGVDNLLSRWQAHVAGDTGITKGLQGRATDDFRFSVLELVAPSAAPDDVIAVEHRWIRRLDTVRFGLNRGDTTL